MSAWYGCERERLRRREGVLVMVVTERDCTGWSECLVWLLQRETAQDGVSAWHGCYRERLRRMNGSDRERQRRME